MPHHTHLRYVNPFNGEWTPIPPPPRLHNYSPFIITKEPRNNVLKDFYIFGSELMCAK